MGKNVLCFVHIIAQFRVVIRFDGLDLLAVFCTLYYLCPQRRKLDLPAASQRCARAREAQSDHLELWRCALAICECMRMQCAHARRYVNHDHADHHR